MYEETQMEKTFRKLKRLEKMLHDRMFIPVDQVEMSVWTTKKPVHEVPGIHILPNCWENGWRRDCIAGFWAITPYRKSWQNRPFSSFRRSRAMRGCSGLTKSPMGTSPLR